MALLEKDLDPQRNDRKVLECSRAKINLLRKWLKDHHFDALLISNRDNFAWITTGANGVLVESGSTCVACLGITRDDLFLFGHPMDTERLQEEQIPEQGYRTIEGKWHQGSPQSFALNKMTGRIATDIPLQGSDCTVVDLHHLHYPLCDLELDRLRWLGAAVNQVYLQMVSIIKPGLQEIDIARYLRHALEERQIDSAVIIVGSDERVFKHRHPLPTKKEVRKYIMLHAGARRWGLHAPITRNYHFGEPPKKIMDAYSIVAEIQAKTFSLTQPGMPFKRVLEAEKEMYEHFGIPHEWEAHYQGGPTGYRIVNPMLGLTDEVIRAGTAFEWFSTIPGMKIAELSMLTERGFEMPSSQNDAWPKQRITLPDGFSVDMPGIYIID